MYPAQRLALFFGILWFIVGSYNMLVIETSLVKAIVGICFMIGTTTLWLYLTGVLRYWLKGNNKDT